MWLCRTSCARCRRASTQLFTEALVASIYQAQSIPAIDAAMRRGACATTREVFSRHESALPLVRAVKRGAAFFNLPDMDFGPRDAAFVPFFGVSAATLLAPSRMARSLKMIVQPILAKRCPAAPVTACAFCPWDDWPTTTPRPMHGA